jgi:hypothetical protein
MENTPSDRNDFWGIYQIELEENGTRIAVDRLGYPATLEFIRELNRDGYAFHEHLAHVGRNVFAGAVLDSLRETFMAESPLDEAEESLDLVPARFLARLVAGSLGNTLEERTRSVSTSPSYAVFERAWLYNARQNGLLDYGIRPWRSNPYAYCTLTFGHLGGKPVLLDSRCYTLLESRRIGLMRIQEQAVIPLFDSCHLAVGVSVYPTEMNTPDWSPSGSMRLERVIRIGSHSGIWYVGALSGPHESRCAAGFAVDW